MIYYFSKQGCSKCDYVKEAVDLNKLGVIEMDVKTIEGLAKLAFYELVGTAETMLPVLVSHTDEGVTTILGAVPIKNHLLGLKEGR